MNIAQIEESLRELVETPFDNATFIYRLLEIYGAPKATVTKLRQANASGDTSEIVVKKKLVLRLSAKGKASSTVDEMAGDIKILKAAPRFLIATDGAELYAKDIKLDQSLDTSYDTLNDSFDFFLPLAGIERYQGVAENPADIKATARLAKLYDAILEVNPNWRDKEHVHELNQLMTRLLFCFFAEGTSIFSKGQFTNSIMKWSQEDGSDTSKVISDIFKSLSLSDSKRAGLPEYAKDFPYVNGGLFKDITALPNFTKRARRLLRECGELDWSTINPDIFGSMIQAIVEPDKRADMGLHYTSLSNIMKVLHPLFLLSLEEEFEAGRDSQTKLQKLLVRLTKIRVFDPACGSGNFLIIAYKELRKLEIRIFKRLKEIGQSSLAMTGIQLNQFFGIEYADFAAETAKLSLWISEYQMNHQFKDEFGDSPPDLPLRESGSINHGNALRLDWLKVCPIDTSLETYVVGNPPYLGSVQQTHEQKEDMRLVFEHLFKKYKDLDYVSAWFLKGSHYSSVTEAKVAFVSTNSITQGEQVSMLWPLIAKNGVEIEFAHLSFKWSNSAASNAAVICVIVGLRKKSDAPKFLYDKGLAHKVKNINAYLISADEVFIEKRSSPLSDLPRMDYGNKPTDGGNLLLSKEEKDELIELYPDSKNLIRKFTGSREFIQGIQRWCLWIEDSQLALAESIPPIAKRISSVRTLRANSNGLQANSNARTPHKFVYAPHKNKENIVVPCHFSERRNYLTVGFSDGEKEVIGNSAAAIFDAPLFIFGVLSSRLHIMWTATVGGRIKTDLRYSNTLVYNTFPLPKLSPEQIDELEERSLEILAARERNSGKTIAWQYDPETMPNDLLQAHKNLDSTLERICLGRDFQSDGERLEYLFKQYAALSNETELKLKARKKMTDFIKVTYAQSGASQSINEMGMRAVQARAYDARNSQYLLIKAPPASGKSRALMFLALDKLAHQGVRKAMVAVPERSIGSSFKSTALSEGGFFTDWELNPKWNLTDAGGAQKTKLFSEFMGSSDNILVCTHATLRFAFESLGVEAFDGCLIAIDEFHHASSDEESKLGELVRSLLLRDKAHIIAMTGSYFRGDTAPVLRPEDEERFNRVSYTYYEQLNGYKNLKTLGIGYHFYRGRYADAIHEVLDPNLKTIVHIPSVRSAASTTNKYEEVDSILDHLGTVLGKDKKTGFYLVETADGKKLKVADLVDDGPDRETVMAALREIKAKDDVDIIIALGMAKEGFDWIWCEHALTVGYRGSLTEIIQIIGRATRDAPNKTHAQFTNLIAEPEADADRVADAVNNMLKAIACSLLMEQVLAPNFKFKTKKDGDELDGSRRESDIHYTGEDSVISIKGFKEPSTHRTKQILETDLADLSAAIYQDETVLRASMSPDEYAPETINQVFIPRVIEQKYPDLSPDELEEVRQAIVAGAVFKSPSISIEEGSTGNGTKFVRMAEKFININELSIDLIERISPFQRAYEIMSKSVTAEVLKTIHSAITAIKIPIQEDEAVMLYPKIQEFTREKGHEPNLNSPNPMEKRMAEVLAWIRAERRKRMANGNG